MANTSTPNTIAHPSITSTSNHKTLSNKVTTVPAQPSQYGIKKVCVDEACSRRGCIHTPRVVVINRGDKQQLSQPRYFYSALSYYSRCKSSLEYNESSLVLRLWNHLVPIPLSIFSLSVEYIQGTRYMKSLLRILVISAYNVRSESICVEACVVIVLKIRFKIRFQNY